MPTALAQGSTDPAAAAATTQIVNEFSPPSGFNYATSPIAGILLLIVSACVLSGLDASGKWIMAAGLPLLAVTWVRYVVHLILALILVVPTKGWRAIRSRSPRDQIVRGVFMLASTLGFFTTLSRLPQAEATAINFLAPLLMLALAPWILKEPARTSRWIAAGIGFAGVLIIVRPGGGLDLIGVMFGLITACLVAAQSIATRRVAVDHSSTTLVWSGAVGSVVLSISLPFALPSALPVLATFQPVHWFVLIGTGLWGCLGHLLQIQAFRNAPASMLAPFVYFQIISAAGFGWLIWGQFPDLLTWIGISIICISGIGIGAYEWRTSNRK
ncbi:MAG TPA: DMT family transporter [Eoetvoesiella sp.]